MRAHVHDHEIILCMEGELSPRRQAWLTQHLAECQACRERDARLRTTMGNVEAWYRTQDAASSRAHADSRARLASVLGDEALGEPTWFQHVAASVGGMPVVRSLGVGAVVMVVCAAAFMAVRVATTPGWTLQAAGALPESTLTPGAVSALTADELCNGVRPSRLVTESVRQQVLRAYQMEHLPATAYELDALITPELGGSTDAANLWPQRYHSPVWNAHVKDELERLLPEMVCASQITLARAQQEIAADWIGAYRRYFKTDAPLPAHVRPSEDEEAELLFVPDQPVMQVATIRVAGR